MASRPPAETVSDDAVLGGRLTLRQPRRGHRVGHDAILLAAACPARAGDAVVDLGAGVGGAGLALAARVPGTTVTLVEIDHRLAELAAQNAQSNGLADRVRAVALDATAPARALAAAGMAAQSITRVLMNPPFHDPARQNVSPDASRRLAHAAPHDHLGAWIRSATRLLRPRGSLTLIWRADGLAAVLAALAPAFGAVQVTPVYPRPRMPAIRVLMTAVKGHRGPLAILPGLLLNDAEGHPTQAAEAVLRDGASLFPVTAPTGERF